MAHKNASRRSHLQADVEEVPTQQLRRRRLIRQIGVIIKIIVFLVVWMYCTVFLVIKAPHESSDVLVPLEPLRPNLIKITHEPEGDQIRIDIQGPIDVDASQDSKLAKDAQPFIMVIVERCNEEINETVSVSKPWHIYLHDGAGSNPDDWAKLQKYIKIKDQQNKWLEKGIGTRSGGSGSSNEKFQIMVQNMHNESSALFVSIIANPLNVKTGIICGTFLLLFLYVLIIWDITDRTFAAMLVATASIGVLSMLGERPDLEKIISWIDMDTLMLLFSMMIMVTILSETGVFDFLSVYAYQMSKGNIWMLLFYLCMFTGILSAFLDNVTMVLLMVPVTIRLCESLELSTKVVLISIAVFSNIGGTLTPVGDPPNVIVATNHYAETHGIVFDNFVLHMFPGVFICMLLGFVMLYFLVRKKIFVKNQMRESLTTLQKLNNNETAEASKRIADLQSRLKQQEIEENPSFEEILAGMKANCKIKNKPLLYMCMVSFGFAILLFFLHSLPSLKGLTLCWVALLAALLLLVLANRPDIDSVLDAVEWSTLIFFAALFVLMEALTEMGLIDFIGECTIAIILSVERSKQLLVSIVMLVWICAIASAFVDNIPITTMMLKLVIKLATNRELDLPFTPLIWSLLFGACFGGNGTLIGASANVVTAGIAGQYGYIINFRQFFVIGFPIMLMTVAVANIYLLIAHACFSWH